MITRILLMTLLASFLVSPAFAEEELAPVQISTHVIKDLIVCEPEVQSEMYVCSYSVDGKLLY